MNTLKTSEIAKQTGLHPNTIRFYEEIGFLTKPVRLPNGYRVYTQLHLAQVRFARLALRAALLHNGLRITAISIIRLCAECNFIEAQRQTHMYLERIDREITLTRRAILSVEAILANRESRCLSTLKRSDAADALGVTVDTLRNWERNGLVSTGRMQNGYRMYTSEDMERLLIIRTLRCANYSLSAILRLTGKLNHSRAIQISQTLNTPEENEEIVSACDHLLSALLSAKDDAQSMIAHIENMARIATLQ